MNPETQAKKTFYCKTMQCSGVTVYMCIKRHVSKGNGRSVFGNSYAICASCNEGAKRKDVYPEIYELALKGKPRDKSKGLKRMNS